MPLCVKSTYSSVCTPSWMWDATKTYFVKRTNFNKKNKSLFLPFKMDGWASPNWKHLCATNDVFPILHLSAASDSERAGFDLWTHFEEITASWVAFREESIPSSPVTKSMTASAVQFDMTYCSVGSICFPLILHVYRQYLHLRSPWALPHTFPLGEIRFLLEI